MSNPDDEDRSALAIAGEWASRILTVSFEMVVPGVLGLWADSKLGTKFVLGIIGFMFGLFVGIWHLLKMTSGNSNNSKRHPRSSR